MRVLLTARSKITIERVNSSAVSVPPTAASWIALLNACTNDLAPLSLVIGCCEDVSKVASDCDTRDTSDTSIRRDDDVLLAASPTLTIAPLTSPVLPVKPIQVILVDQTPTGNLPVASPSATCESIMACKSAVVIGASVTVTVTCFCVTAPIASTISATTV